MPVDVKLPTMLRAQADGQATVAVEGATVGDVFTSLVERYPGPARATCSTTPGGLHKFVNVYSNDDDIRYLDRLDTKVADGDVIVDPARGRGRLTCSAGAACATTTSSA